MCVDVCCVCASVRVRVRVVHERSSRLQASSASRERERRACYFHLGILGSGRRFGAGNVTQGLGGAGRQRRDPLSRRNPLFVLFVLQGRSRLPDEDVLPQAPLPRDPSFDDGHSSVFSLTTLSPRPGTLRSLALALSLALLSRGHSVSTRATPLRAREWRLSRLARPYHRASALPSSLPACFPAYLPTCARLSTCLPLSPPD